MSNSELSVSDIVNMTISEPDDNYEVTELNNDVNNHNNDVGESQVRLEYNINIFHQFYSIVLIVYCLLSFVYYIFKVFVIICYSVHSKCNY